MQDCLGPTHADRIGTEALLRRQQAAGSARSARLPRLRPRRWRRPVLVAALAAVALGTATTVTYTLRDEAPAAAAAPTCEKPR